MRERKSKQKERDKKSYDSVYSFGRALGYIGCLALPSLLVFGIYCLITNHSADSKEKQLLIETLRRTSGISAKPLHQLDLMIHSEKGDFMGHGGLVEYDNGDKIFVTVGHVLCEERGKASIEVLDKGKRVGWIRTYILPWEIQDNVKRDPERMADVIYCRLGEKAELSPVPLPITPKIRQQTERIKPWELVSVADKDRKAYLMQVTNYDTPYPVFVASFFSQPGDSGSLYYCPQNSKIMFLLSGATKSDNGSDVTLFVPVIPMKMEEEKQPTDLHQK